MEDSTSSISYRSKNIVRFDLDLTGSRVKGKSELNGKVNHGGLIPAKVIQPDELYDDKEVQHVNCRVNKSTSSFHPPPSSPHQVIQDDRWIGHKGPIRKTNVKMKVGRDSKFVDRNKVDQVMLPCSRKQIQILPDLDEDSGREDDERIDPDDHPSSIESDGVSHESEEDDNWESNSYDSAANSGSPPLTDSDYEQRSHAAVMRDISRPYSAYLKRFLKLKTTLEKWNTFLSQNNGAMSNSRMDFNKEDSEEEDEEEEEEEDHQDDNVEEEKRRISENRESLKLIFDEFKHLASRHQQGFLGAISGENCLQKFVSSSDNNNKFSDHESTALRESSERYHSTEIWARKQSATSRLKVSQQQQQDAVSPEEAHLKQKLRNLSSELVTLRNSLHVNNGQQQINGTSSQQQQQSINIANNTNNNSTVTNGNSIPGIIPMLAGALRYNPSQQVLGGGGGGGGHSIQNYTNKPLPPHPPPPNNNHHNNNNNHQNHNNNNNNNNNNNSTNLNHNTNNNLINNVHNNNNNNNNNSHNNNNHNNSSNGYYVNQHFPTKQDVSRVNGNGGGGGDGNQSEEKAFGSLIGTVTTNSASGGDATPSESSFKLLSSSTSGVSSSMAAVKKEDFDLTHLYGPLTEDSLIRCLQARCEAAKYYVHMGQIVLMANPLTAVGNPLTLSSTKEIPTPPPIQKIVEKALRQERDTNSPQAIILSGCSGSGKTYTSMLVLRQLFEQAGGGVDTDAFKRVEASMTVLRSLGTARTALNNESSRIGHFFDVSVTGGAVYRTKVHCYFLDQSRVVKRAPGERNYHIFYQMLAGLNPEERALLNLGDHTVRTLRYLRGSGVERSVPGEEAEDARRFRDWKASLEVLGITFMEVVRVLTSVLLLGNVQFVDSACDLEIEGNAELQAAADLLGVSDTALRQGLTTRTHNVRNQLVRSRCDASMSNFSRDALAKSLYCRTVSTIVRRANNVRRLTSTAGTLSSDSTDSVHHPAETQSQHASTVGTAGSKASKSMTALNNAVRATDGCIGILDMFGFEDVKPGQLEHLCVNLCAEAMQHCYNTQIFKKPMEACRDEGIRCDWEVEYLGNIPCIDLMSTMKTGLFNMLDNECLMKGTVESYVQKVRLQHKQNPRFVESTKAADLRSFGIQHYAGIVQYNATEFLDTNRDIIADDIVAVFHKHTCSFGFASHLFSTELKILGAGGMEPSARGISFRISHPSCSVLLKGNEPVSSLTHDFHDRLNNLLQSLVQFRHHFISCIKINNNLEQHDIFDRHTVSKQLRAFQILETINFMANGYPHRMRFKLFNARYRLLAPFHQLSRTDDRATEDCQLILECVDNSLDDSVRERLGHVSIRWAIGKRHVFMSEGARQQLEAMCIATRNRAATIIQSTWRGSHSRKRWPYCQSGYYPRYQSSTIHGPSTMSLQSAAMLHNNANTAVTPNQPHLMSAASHHQAQTNGNSNINGSNNNNNTIYRNGMIVSSAAASSMGNLHTMQSHLAPHSNMPPGPLGPHHDLCSSPPPIIPIPAPRSNNSGGLTSPPAIPSINTTSVATISIVNSASGGITGGRPRPISGTPPPDSVMERCDPKLVQQTCNIENIFKTCNLFGLDMERPPPLPPSRSYTVAGNTKLGYPQTRVMKMTYPDEGTATDIRLLKCETVLVVGASARRGHLLVEYKNRNIHVPYQYLELAPTNVPSK